MYILELGRSQNLSLMEIEALSGKDNILGVHGDYCLIEEFNEDLKTLGGVLKWFEILGEFRNLEALYEGIYDDLSNVDRKIFLGFDWKLANKNGFSIKVKDFLKEKGLSVAVIGDRSSKYTSTGAILRRKVLSKGAHFLIYQDGNEYLLGKCTQVQDISSFEKKDYEKPVRDMNRGMMPPKLARMIVNIARGVLAKDPVVWDPFCGLGSTLFECIDLGIECIGSDIDEKAVNGSRKNIEWYGGKANIFVHDATEEISGINPNIVCAEGYLGQLVTEAKINKEFIEHGKESLKVMYKKVFEQFAKMRSLEVICLALPFWILNGKDHFLCRSTFDQLEGFAWITEKKLLYKRKDNVVGREIVLLQKT